MSAKRLRSARLRLLAWVVLLSSSACACSDDPGADENQAGAMAQAGAPVVGAMAGSAGVAPNAVAGAAGTGNSPAMSGAVGTAVGAGGNAGMNMGTSAGAAAGSAGNAAAGSDAAGSGDPGAEPAAGAAGAAPIDTGTLPPVMDPEAPGAFTPKWEMEVGPGRNYTTITPMELGKDGVKHPILIWGPGAGAYPEIYKSLLDHIASHGFVIVSYNTTPAGPELNDAIDWIEAEAKRDGSPYFGKVDVTKIAMGGQSAGSLATFQAGGDERLTTTLHINGGTFNGRDVQNLKQPALFICGDDPAVSGGDGTWESDLARPNCDRDFTNAKTPVWYGVVIGSSHTTVIDNPSSGMPVTSDALKKRYNGANAAWLRWQLAGDLQMKERFVGPSCGYCMQKAEWLVQQKDLN